MKRQKVFFGGSGAEAERGDKYTYATFREKTQKPVVGSCKLRLR